jgi:broad specificity phosphatase PhoE
MPLRIYLRRHAERPSNEQLGRHGDTGITPRGKRHAVHLGKSIRNQIGSKPILFLSTDRLRAVQSAQGMSRGAGNKEHPRTLTKLTSLVRPEAKIRYRAELKGLTKKTNEEIIREWLQGKIGKHLVYTPQEEVENFIRYVVKSKRIQKKGKGLPRIEVITHDSTLAAFAYLFLGKIPEGTHQSTKQNPSQIGYLEAIQLAIEPTRVRMKFKGKWHDVTGQFNQYAQKFIH